MPTNTHKHRLQRLFAAIFYDLIIVFFGLFMLVGFAVLPVYKGLTGHESIEAGNVFFPIFLATTAFLYYALSWRIGGQTIGMKAWRLVLVSTDGQNSVTWRQIITRFLAAFLSAAPAFLGYLYAIFQKDRLTLHDLLSHTHMHYVPKPGKNLKNTP